MYLHLIEELPLLVLLVAIGIVEALVLIDRRSDADHFLGLGDN